MNFKILLSNDYELASDLVLLANNRPIVLDRTLKDQGIRNGDEICISQRDEKCCENSDVEEEFLIVHNVAN